MGTALQVFCHLMQKKSKYIFNSVLQLFRSNWSFEAWMILSFDKVCPQDKGKRNNQSFTSYFPSCLSWNIYLDFFLFGCFFSIWNRAVCLAIFLCDSTNGFSWDKIALQAGYISESLRRFIFKLVQTKRRCVGWFLLYFKINEEKL